MPSIAPVYAEVARVTRPGGIYISQHKQPTSLQISHRNERHQFVVGVEYYHRGPLPRQIDDSYRESGATEYLHRLEDLVGGLARSGLMLEDLREPVRANYKPRKADPCEMRHATYLSLSQLGQVQDFPADYPWPDRAVR